MLARFNAFWLASPRQRSQIAEFRFSTPHPTVAKVERVHTAQLISRSARGWRAASPDRCGAQPPSDPGKYAQAYSAAPDLRSCCTGLTPRKTAARRVLDCREAREREIEGPRVWVATHGPKGNRVRGGHGI